MPTGTFLPIYKINDIFEHAFVNKNIHCKMSMQFLPYLYDKDSTNKGNGKLISHTINAFIDNPRYRW